jgi:uncharacterized protein YeaO (DUF488 family)
MTLYTGCIYTNSHCGTRISVMSRHTLKDGRTPDPQITPASFNEWWMELSPPPRLVAEYYHHSLPWERFRKEYLRYLHQTPARHVLRHLTRWAHQEDFTLLCVEATPERCHRSILAEECLRREPNLEVVVR